VAELLLGKMNSQSDTSEEELELILISSLLRKKRKKRRKRRFWVRPYIKKRYTHGHFCNLLQEMRLSDPESHFRYLRMSKDIFDELLGKVNVL